MVAPAHGQPLVDVLRLEGPPELIAGQRAMVVAEVDVAPELPLLVTPRSEGTALDVVRGRLTRGDALDSDTRPLQFRIPVVARTAGTAILRVHLTTFRCDDHDECVPVEAEASLTLRIRASPAPP